MKPTRQTQPYRRGARQPGQALTNMLRGRSASGWNPKDVERQAQKILKRATDRKARPARQPRQPRPTR